MTWTLAINDLGIKLTVAAACSKTELPVNLPAFSISSAGLSATH